MSASIYEETIMIPTYPVGKPEKNPMFIEKRVYQGSSGRVYPYPVIESVGGRKENRPYKAIFLENEYLKVCVLPELGGRIQRAYDKTTGYDFVYYNHVIKPALVGLLGPWISGGIEFNWPQHHRPTTFLPVDYVLQENKDGSVSVLLSDRDRIYGTKGICRITLYPGVSYIEIQGQLYNGTPLPQTFLWWANPAVPVNDHTQTIMPPDVHAVMDHGKRDVSRWPIATGTYYKKDYSEGVDISRYKNIPVPTSLMAAKSKYDFVGGYDYSRGEGILHVADHHVSPGKKQWTWGCGDFGKAWDRNLTDTDGPYAELMTGVFTDNQPDFTWLKPFEEKTFTQYFMPYKGVGVVQNATKEACVGLEITDAKHAQPEGADGTQDAVRNAAQKAVQYAAQKALLHVTVYATAAHENAVVTVLCGGETILSESAAISPTEVFDKTVDVPAGTKESECTVRVSDGGRLLVSCTPEEETIPEIPDPAKPAEEPENVRTNEELYLTGLHLEQYRHATFLPDPYYLEGLKRDPGDSRINTAYGLLLLRRGRADLAERYFRAAVKRLTLRNPNPYNSDAYYGLGLCLLAEAFGMCAGAATESAANTALSAETRLTEAYDAFFKATWSAEQQYMAFYWLAVLDMRKGNYAHALEMIEKSLARNTRSVKARGLKAVALRKAGLAAEAQAFRQENLAVDPFDAVSLYEETGKLAIHRQAGLEMLEGAKTYALMGCCEEALAILEEAKEASADDGSHPLIHYYRAYFLNALGRSAEAEKALSEAEAADPAYCFPNELSDIAVLRFAIARGKDAKAARALYYLGCLYYDKQQWELSEKLWEASAEQDPTFPAVFRGLSLIYFNKRRDPEKASAALEKAFALDESDTRMFYELDQLRRKTGWNFAARREAFEAHMPLVLQRDDLCAEYALLLNACDAPEKALDFLLGRRFHPWEGGEGRVSTQYGFSLLRMAEKEMRAGTASGLRKAAGLLEKALVYPDNLGEGKLEGTKDNHIHYLLGLCAEKTGDAERATAEFTLATLGTDEPAGVMYYNDQPADMILYQGLAFLKLGQKGSANKRFYRLIDFGERHLKDHMKIDYFAVSLPDFLTFEDDLDVRNRAHCLFLMALGRYGLGETEKAGKYLAESMALDPSDFRKPMTKRILEDL